jgi:hypothetical protein
MENCKNCLGEIKETWGFQTTGDGVHVKSHYFCSKKCGDEYAQKLMHKGYVEVGNVMDTGTR